MANCHVQLTSVNALTPPTACGAPGAHLGSDEAHAAQSGPIEAITIHPPVSARFQCSEHPLGAEDHVPDALAADCVVVRRDGGPSGNLASLYTGDGTRNEDWHSWREPLLAPFDGVVLAIQINPESTPPGVRGSGRSSAIGFQQLVDGELTDVHVREVAVSQGDTVRAGEPVARIGNNGSSFHPHVHVGAFRGDMMSEDAVPLQVRMDLAAMGRVPGGGGDRWLLRDVPVPRRRAIYLALS